MKWTPDPELKQKLIDSLTKKYSDGDERRNRIHVTDLTHCLRESYFKKVNPKPANERILGFYVDGSRRHIIIEDLHGATKEVKTGNFGVGATIDLLDDLPIEIKTSRGGPKPPATLEERYGLQIGYYAIITEKNQARFIVQWLNPREDQPTFECYKVEFEPGEAERFLNQLQTNRDRLKLAIGTRNPRLLPKIKADKAWKCRSCRWQEECSKLD